MSESHRGLRRALKEVSMPFTLKAFVLVASFKVSTEITVALKHKAFERSRDADTGVN